jgi:hypothetical protein
MFIERRLHRQTTTARYASIFIQNDAGFALFAYLVKMSEH